MTDLFEIGQAVSYLTFIEGQVLHHGTVLAPSHMHKDYDGDGPKTEPYKVYPIEYEGGLGVGGYWPEFAMLAGHPPIGTAYTERSRKP